MPEGRSEPYCCKRMRLTAKETLSSFEAFSTGGIFPQVIEPCAQGEGSSAPTVFFIGRLSPVDDEAYDPKST